ncbi:MAG: D-tyrosyl-tRNA(Tyr) deacylase [Gammaproteobacteria bacterium]|nr:D-tyrosyl-tRNA(Tyr) deacylase [Gammaproteobacteria bacterium]
MRVLIQRVRSASVSVYGERIGSIGNGALLFVGFTHRDCEKAVTELASKTVNLRIFPDEQGRLQHSLIDVGGEILAVPQFTLYASTNRGRRPDFTHALAPDQASDLFDKFVFALDRVANRPIATGKFGTDMKVNLENDGPFTVMLAREPTD